MTSGLYMKLFVLSLSALFPMLLTAQYYNLGQDPASLKWRQIKTPDFRIIYPETFELRAQKMPRILNFIYANGTKTLDFKPKPVPFIIHNYNTEPNAVTVWAPKRIELFTCPPQDMYAQDWINQLVIHEYRHVVQLDRTNQGFTKVLSWLMGEQAAASINGLFVPSWFMEGDAVCTETVLSKSGRGRLPAFEMFLRTQIAEKGAFTYDKAAMGSYKSFVPNQYVLGYSLVANVRRKYGYKAWVSALDEVARKPFVITPFNKGLKKETGFGKENLYCMSMSDLDSMWRYQDENIYKTPFTPFSAQSNKKYENYKFPYYLNDTLVVAEFTSLDDITRFVVLGPNGFKQVIHTPGFLSSENYSIVKQLANPHLPEIKNGEISIRNFKLAFTESINDPRWGQRNFSVIRIFDSETGKTSELTPKSRYFAPALSPDGKLIAAITVSPENRYSLVLIGIETGKETDTIITSLTDFYMTPSWSEDGKKIVFTKLDAEGKSIELYEFDNKEITTIIPATFIDIANPVFAGEYVLFNGSYSGIENIYAVDLANSERVFQVTSARFGACNPDLSPDGRRIVYSNYSSGGYGIVEAEFNPKSWKPLNEVEDFSPSLYKHLVDEEDVNFDFLQDTNLVFQSEPYKKGLHIFNFHSWAPAYINYMEGENGAGISFMSQNELSTATTIVGYKYDMAENTGKVTIDFSWQAWYPMIDLKTSYGARTAYTGGDSSVRYNFNETVISGGLTLPLLFTGGKYYKGIRLQAFTSWNNITDNTSPDEDKLTGTIQSLDYSFYAYRLIKQSYNDLFPRWGQSITGSYRHSPLGDNNLGRIVSAGTRFYFPGMIRHHGIRIDLNWQYKNKGTYTYSNQINLPRGYNYIDAEKLACFALNYKFPFAYPDFALGPLVYFKRLKANLFFDGGKATGHDINQQLQSAGVELTSDMHLLRFVFPVDLGVRLGYQPLEKQYFADFLFSVNL
jgi:hypothetical protein